MERILILAVVFGAVIFLIRHVGRVFKGDNPCSGCGKSCSTREELK